MVMTGLRTNKSLARRSGPIMMLTRPPSPTLPMHGRDSLQPNAGAWLRGGWRPTRPFELRCDELHLNAIGILKVHGVMLHPARVWMRILIEDSHSPIPESICEPVDLIGRVGVKC